MRRTVFLLFLVGTTVLPSLSHAQCTRYVSTTGSDPSNNCVSSSELQAGSPAIDAGADYSFAPTVGIVGAVRPDATNHKWDLGAYEYNSAAGAWPWF